MSVCGFTLPMHVLLEAVYYAVRGLPRRPKRVTVLHKDINVVLWAPSECEMIVLSVETGSWLSGHSYLYFARNSMVVVFVRNCRTYEIVLR